MKTRNSTTPKPAPAKKTPPSRKSAAKTAPKEAGIESATPKTTDLNSASASSPTASVDLNPEQTDDTVEVTPETKGTRTKTTKRVVVRKTPVRTKTPTSGKSVPRNTPKLEQTEKVKVGEPSDNEEAGNAQVGESSGKEEAGEANVGEPSDKEEAGEAKLVDSSKKEEPSLAIVDEAVEKEEPSVENVEAAKRLEDPNVMKGEEPPTEKEDIIGMEKLSAVDLKTEQPGDAVEVTLPTKLPTEAKTTKKVMVRKTVARTKTPTSTKAVPTKTPKSEQAAKFKVGESSKKEEGGDAMDVDYAKKEESSISNADEPVKEGELSVENVKETKRVEDQDVTTVKDPPREKEEVGDAVPRKTPKLEQAAKFKVGESSGKEDGGHAMDVNFAKKEESSILNADEPVKEGELSYENVEETVRAEDQNVTIVSEPPREKGEGGDARSKTPTSTKAVPRKTPKSEQAAELKVGESYKKEEGGDAMDVDSAKKEESFISNTDEHAKDGELSVEKVEETIKTEDQNVTIVKDLPWEKEEGGDARSKIPTSTKAVPGKTPKSEQAAKLKVGESYKKVEGGDAMDVDSAKKEESFISNAEEHAKEGELSVEKVEETIKAEDQNVTIVKDLPREKEEGSDARSKTPTSTKAVLRETPKSEQAEKLKVGESSKKEEGGDALDVDSAKKEESSISNAEEHAKEGELPVENVEETKRVENQNVTIVKDPPQDKEEVIDVEQPLVPNVEISTRQEDSVTVDVAERLESQEPGIPREEEEVKEEGRKETTIIADDVGPENESVSMEEDMHKLTGEDTQCEDECHGNEKTEECTDQEVIEELEEEELVADDIPEHGEEEALEEENRELTAAAKERKMRKELEIFVGGMDRDAVEEDVRKAFENYGDVVEVRLHKSTSADKNKGYAFVKFATKEQASRALSELKNPLICGKRCRTGPSEDNDSLFLGNICNTWTKEAIKQKMEHYGVEGVQNITLVADARQEGLSRGFAFIEFSCHADAMLAYKRLQKPDVIFGHTERTAKVAFAEPLREPDPDVMAKVKSVFIDGLHPNLDEDRVREQMKRYGEIARIMLARKMSTAKRRDFGFVDFTTHEAAVACVEGINDKILGDGNWKTKVKARLSNPLPKTQAIKGGMCGGFRIGRAGAGSFSKFGRGFGRGAHALSRPNFPRGRGFYHRGNVPTWRMGFAREENRDIQYPPFQRREMSGQGGWRDSFGGAVDTSRGGTVPARPNLGRGRHNAPNRGHGMPMPTRREPFPHEEGYNRSFGGQHFDDPYFYDGHAHGTKRPFFMADQDPDYMERSRHRPRLDYPDPAVPIPPPRYPDSFGAGSSLYTRDYYGGADYGEGSYSSFYGNDRPYGRGYYY